MMTTNKAKVDLSPGYPARLAAHPIMRASGGWADRTDLDKLVAEIYADRQAESIVPSRNKMGKEEPMDSSIAEQREALALCEAMVAEIEADLTAIG